jgi:hypothetical protein
MSTIDARAEEPNVHGVSRKRRWILAGVLSAGMIAALAYARSIGEPSSADIAAEAAALNIGVEVGDSMYPYWLWGKLPGPLQEWAHGRRYVTGLFGTNITDSHLARWSTMTRLGNLHAPFSQVTDDGLQHLRGMPKLGGVFLIGAPITDNGMVHLRTLPRLAELDLRDTAISDAGLEELSAIPTLTKIQLGGTRVTDAGVAEFQRLNPNCKIER